MKKYNVGLIGLAVMGENLARNIESKGYSVAVYTRNQSKVQTFIQNFGDKNFAGANSYVELIDMLERPRKIILMIKAGNPVDQVIEELIEDLEPGDIIVDGGNSHYLDTIRRTKYIEEKGLLFIGAGVSGGEEGALKGPSIMPGGSKEAWKYMKPILQNIAAKTDDGEVCCDWIGSDGAGHFVKMVHNGIEYGDIQIIGETYHIMKEILNLTNNEIHEVFEEWNKSELNSYLIEITSEIFNKLDDNGDYVIDKILDTAGQKGTGKWTAISSIEEGVPLTLIGEAVFSRFLSSLKEERVNASKLYNKKIKTYTGDKKVILNKLRQALYSAKIVSYAQGFSLLQKASETNKWNIDFGQVAILWKGGCIIRSVFLNDIKSAYDLDDKLPNLLLNPFFKEQLSNNIDSWREIAALAILSGVPIPALSSSLAYFDGYLTEKLPANLLQAQRDFFGAHTYERNDRPRGEYYHTDWTGKGGKTASSSYNA